MDSGTPQGDEVAAPDITLAQAGIHESVSRAHVPPQRRHDEPGQQENAEVELLGYRVARRRRGRRALSRRRDGLVAFPDVRITPLLSVSEGGWTFSEVRITGTNTGEIALGDFGWATAKITADAVGATGRSIDIRGVIVHEVDEEGLVVAERQYWGLL